MLAASSTKSRFMQAHDSQTIITKQLSYIFCLFEFCIISYGVPSCKTFGSLYYKLNLNIAL